MLIIKMKVGLIHVLKEFLQPEKVITDNTNNTKTYIICSQHQHKQYIHQLILNFNIATNMISRKIVGRNHNTIVYVTNYNYISQSCCLLLYDHNNNACKVLFHCNASYNFLMNQSNK